MICATAACHTPAVQFASGWPFCDDHLDEHHKLMRGEDLADLPPLPKRKQRARRQPECGTEAGWAAHRRHHTTMCDPCVKAARAADRERKYRQGRDAINAGRRAHRARQNAEQAAA